MKTKTMQRQAAGAATGNGGEERGVHAASTSSQGNPSSLAGAVVSRTVKRAKARAPVRVGRRFQSSRPASGSDGRRDKFWQLRLYVTGQTPKSLTAFSNLKKFCENHLRGRYRLTVIDLVKQPHLAKGDQILAIPTVVRKLPKPVRIIIGNLSDLDHVLVGLDLRPAD